MELEAKTEMVLLIQLRGIGSHAMRPSGKKMENMTSFGVFPFFELLSGVLQML